MMAIPERQLYPSRLKVGDTLYTVLAYTGDDGRSCTEYEEWTVRSIRAKRGTRSRMGLKVLAEGSPEPMVNLTQKIKDLTWVKRDGQFGWSPSISSWLKKQFSVGERLPLAMYTTQRSALLYAIRRHEQCLADYDKWIFEEPDETQLLELKQDRTSHEAELKALRIRFKKGWK